MTTQATVQPTQATQADPPMAWRKIKALGKHERAIEMALAADYVNQESISQFFRDLRRYNLEQAFMNAPDCEITFALALAKFN